LPQQGLKLVSKGRPGGEGASSGDSGYNTYEQPTFDMYQDALGRSYAATSTDANGNPILQARYGNSDGSWENPLGGGKGRVQPTYTLNAEGTATPLAANVSYDASNWVSLLRDPAIALGTVLSAGAAGYYGAGAAAAEGAGGGLATSAPAYGGVGTAGAGAGTDAIIGGASLPAASGPMGGAMIGAGDTSIGSSIGQWIAENPQFLPAADTSILGDGAAISAATAAAGGSSGSIPSAGGGVAGLTSLDSTAYAQNGDQLLQGGGPAGFFSAETPGSFSSILGQLGGYFGRGGQGQGLIQLMSSLYGLSESNKLKKNSQAPGMTKAGLQAVIRGMAAQGYQGSGNMMTALERYGAETNRGDAAGQAAGLSGELSSLGLLTSSLSKLFGTGGG
jgi:hypothetical protein